jgi:glycosyltransferase involved in cell wall biosynthesis/SAM-dependent methyltransferase
MPARLEWTPQLISRFWDGVAQSPALDGMSFAKLGGPILIEFMGPWIASGAHCLDYGGGSGHLLALMVEAGYSTAFYEPSIQRAAKITASMEGESRFLGTIPLSDPATFDFVICTEVIEHILTPDIDNFMRSMTRRVAPGGLLLLTTPFAENLAENEVYCPCCDHVFHRWQHQRSWQIADIESLMKRWGLATEWLGRAGFDDLHCVRDFHLRRSCGEPRPWLDDGKIPLIGRGDHIVYIGRKPNEMPMSRSEAEGTTPAGLAEAEASGVVPPVPPSLDQFDAPIDIVANGLVAAARAEAVGGANGGKTGNGVAEAGSLPGMPLGTIIVLPGSGSLPQAAAFVFDGRWRRARPVVSHMAKAGNEAPNRGHIGSLIERTKARLLGQMRRHRRVRRIQPWFDRRERYVLPTLLSPGDFPHRLTHVVEGRILLGVSSLTSGGAERQVLNTVQGLRARGLDDVHLLVEYLHDTPENAFYRDKADKVAAGVHVIPDHDYGTSPWALQHPEFREVMTAGFIGRILNAAAVIKKLAPEIVQTSLDWTNITVGVAAVLAGVPKVFISGRNLAPIHFEFFQWFMYPCYRALAAHPNVRILNNSDAGRRDYARWLKLAPDRIKVLRNGLATDEFMVVDEAERSAARRKLGIADDVRIIAGAFRLSAEKRPMLWIATAAKIKARMPNAVFLLCGIGPMDAEVRSAAASLGLGDSIQYLGVRNDIQTIFAASDLVLQTSLQEGTPNTLIEAQAMGIPVVTTAAFGAAEAVEHGVTGLVVRDETATSLADAVASILGDTRLRASAREAGPKFIEARFGFDRMVDCTLRVYADAGVSWAHDFLSGRHRTVRLQGLKPDSGYAWTVDLPQLEASSDDLKNPRRSRLTVLEDGKPLGPAHTAHDVIRSEGGGALSHWRETLYFSSSDHTDPSSNGRKYVAIISH